jgi:RES domain-containing protein
LYRVSNHADLTGKGGELADGRWHTRQLGRRIVYLSDHPALCLLEILVPISERDWLPDWYQLLSANVPDHLIERLEPETLSEGWQNDPTITQQIGNSWLASEKSGLLVPSVIVPASMNCIINPLAPGIKALDVQVVGRFPFDKRLKRVQSDDVQRVQ